MSEKIFCGSWFVGHGSWVMVSWSVLGGNGLFPFIQVKS